MKLKSILFGIIVLFIGIVVGVAMIGGSNTQHNTSAKEDIFEYTNWTYTSTDKISSLNTAPKGCLYYIVDVKINNKGTQTYSTNPYYWQLEANGLKYSVCAATFDPAINSQSVNVKPGGSFETKFVFLVNGDYKKINLDYIGPTTA